MKYICNQTLQKKIIRKYIRTVRRSLTLQEQYIATQLLTNQILATNHIYQSTHIAIFISFDGEINTIPLIKVLLSMKKKIYLPTISNIKSQHLLFYKYTLSIPLVHNHLQIYEPQKNNSFSISTEILDIIFVPLIAFDKYGNRLGMGSGLYDKTLQYLKKKSSFVSIGLAYDFQKISSQLFPIEPWDIKLSEIITPSHYWKSKNVK